MRAEKSKPLRFGTSGLRALVTEMTDMECYINTKGFIGFLKERKELKACRDGTAPRIALGGDLRSSTPGIMTAVKKAIEDTGCAVDFCGVLPSPALASYAIREGIPSIMVTGSHIPDDRNGIKFTKTSGEVLKTDEADILKNVALARNGEYAKNPERSLFDDEGMFKEKPALPGAGGEAIKGYQTRYLEVFPADALRGVKIALYQHSAVGRDIIREIFEGLGAEVIAVARSENFVPVDTEKISDETRALLRKAADEYAPFAVISTDGDSDRPLLADGKGEFIPGDKLGALVSMYLEPDFAAIPVSANDAVVSALSDRGIKVRQTRIGSPYVIAAMNDKLAGDPGAKVVGWESNGGFLLGSDWKIGERILKALPTRDAVLPLLAVLLLARKEGKTVSELISTSLPRRYTHADVVDNKTKGCESYTAEMGKKMISMFSPADSAVSQLDYKGAEVTVHYQDGRVEKAAPESVNGFIAVKERIGRYFNGERGFGEIVSVNFIDGIRIVFANNDVSHIRPSGNAPEFRNYATADTQERANGIVEKRKEIVAEIVADMAGQNPAAAEVNPSAGVDTSAGRIVSAIRKGKPVYIRPYEQPKVWGVNGIGEYWYGAEAGEKSSTAVVGEDTAPMADMIRRAPGELLGKKVVNKFGQVLPLVKILTPKGRLSVQFHDAKNELWIVTGADGSVAGGEPGIILGFSDAAVREYGDKVTEGYGKVLREYGKALNALIDILEGDDRGRTALEDTKDAAMAAGIVRDKVPAVSDALAEFETVRRKMEWFYNHRPVKVGDVIPVPSGTLHALGPGVEVVEPQIPGPTQSLEDGATYPVRYFFPGYKRPGGQKELDLDRVNEMSAGVTKEALPEIIKSETGCVVELLPGNFGDKGLEVHRITMDRGSEMDVPAVTSFHNLVTVEGKAKVVINGEGYDIPAALPGGEMLIVPASAGSYRILSDTRTQIIDTFTPV